MYRIALLSIGDELCIGQVVNTNVAWIAQQCSQRGALITEHAVVADDAGAMLSALTRMSTSNHMLLVTGGLGPTHDDITKDVLCTFFQDTLQHDARTHERLVRMFELRQRPLTPRNQLQAMLPSTAMALDNDKGTAPGLFFDRQPCAVIAMPGVPAEMQGIMKNSVLPLIEERIRAGHFAVRRYSTITVAGIAESSLADVLGEPESFLEGQSLAFLPSYTGVRLRISVTAANDQLADEMLSRIATYIRSKAGQYVVSEDDRTLNQALHERLIANGVSLALAESCTAGMLGELFSENPGCSAYLLGGIICYSNQSKHRELDVPLEVIETHGAVSKEVVELLATNARKRFESDYALAISGIAGPDGGSADKPVGTVWIALAGPKGAQASLHHFGSDRRANRERACAEAQRQLLQELN